MSPETVQFSIEKRKNVFAKNAVEWAFLVKIDGADSWCIFTWDAAPSEDQVSDMEDVFLRSCEVYHRHIKMQPFHLKEEEKK
jgi:hypothetical protein